MSPKRALRCVFESFVFTIVVSLVPATAQVSPGRSQVPSRIVSPIDESVRVTIPRSTHPMAKPALDVGALVGSTQLKRMILILGGSADQEYQARTLLDSQHTRGSPDYHHWLTPEEFGTKFGPSLQDITQVTGWLQQHGFTIGSIAKSGRWIEFAGTSAQVEQTFQTQMRQYMVQGELHVANAINISIPAALSPVVRGVLSLHNFYSQPMLRHSKTIKSVTIDRSKPNATDSNGNHFVTPGDLATIYNLTPLYNGTWDPSIGSIIGGGQSIAVVAVGNINTIATTGIDDVAAFRQVFGLPGNSPHIILNGPDPGIDGASDEATLDVEYSGAMAPGATIDLVVSGGTLTTDPVALSSAFIVDQDLAPVMSVSFGICEQALTSGADANSFWNALWQQAAAQGISVFVSSGDTGAAGCDPNQGFSSTPAQGGLAVNGFGSTAFNTSVGGTEFNETVNGGIASTFWHASNGPNLASAIGYIPEKVWNDSCAPTDAGSFCQQNNVFVFASGGGGISTMWAVPSYQTLNIQGLTGVNFPFRPVPDVSLNAANDHDPYIFCFTSDPAQPDCQVIGNTVIFNNFAGGTSFSSPEFAGIMALVNEATAFFLVAGAPGRQGLANYVLYSLASNESQGAGGFSSCNSSSQTNPANPPGPQCVFNDVTTGNNGVAGNDTLSSFVPPGDTAGQTGYNAVAGYDPAIGLGSINATALVKAWTSAVAKFQGSMTTLTSTSTPPITITHGTPVSFTSTVKNLGGTTPTPAGAISLIAEGGNLPSPVVGIVAEPISGSGGTAMTGPVNVNNLPGGSGYSITALYPGDGVIAGSNSLSFSPVTVNPENTTTTLKSFIFNANTGAFAPGTVVGYGDPVNILVIDADTAGVSGLLPATGNVTFVDNNNAVTPKIGIDNSGIAEFADCFSASCFAIGQHNIAASYSGDATPPLSYNGSATSSALAITVTRGTPVPAISALSTAGVGVPFTINVQIETLGTIVPTGTVQLLDGTTGLGAPVTLSGGQASQQVTLTTTGKHNLTAQYSGDSTYTNATSAVAVVTVAAPFNFTATSTSQTIPAGGTATYNVVLNGVGGFAGQVNFTCMGAPGGSNCAVSPNPATLSSTTTSVALTVTISNTSNAQLRPNPLKGLPIAFAGVVAVMIAGLRKKPRRCLFLFLALFLVGGVSSCGGGGGSTPHPPTVATLTVTGTSGSTTSSIMLTLTVTH